MTRQLHACRLFPNRQHVETVRRLHCRKRGFMIHETLFHDSFLQMRYEEKTDYLRKRLSRLRELRELPFGTRTADELWKSRLDYNIAFMQKLAEQMERSKSVIGMR